MRHSYIDRPRRIRAPRATPRSRARFLPALMALPAVGVLWLTVGLPMLSQLTGAGGSGPLARTVVFETQASGSGAGGDGGAPAPQTVASVTVSNDVLSSYHAEVARRARAHARAAKKLNAKGQNPALPQPALHGATPSSPSRSPSRPHNSATSPAHSASGGGVRGWRVNRQ